jgi:hypothetical protein
LDHRGWRDRELVLNLRYLRYGLLATGAFLWLMHAFSTLPALHPSPPPPLPSPPIGTWSGTVTQDGFGTYPMTLTLSDATSGSTEYPSLPCKGTLHYVGVRLDRKTFVFG